MVMNLPADSLVEPILSTVTATDNITTKSRACKKNTYLSRRPDSISGSGSSPGEGNSYHSSILAWRIPWTEEPGMLQSMGSQRVTHD